MIQKAIVESIENNYQVKVRIPKYNKMANDVFSYNDLSTSIICSSPGTLVSYSVGDIVLVGFENNEIDKPVILGLLYTENNRGDSIDFPELSEALNSVTSSVQKLEKANSYIHIRYSNDNGVTFTSLYDYSDEKYDLETNKYYASNIVCNPESSFIIWNIVDNYGKNAVDKVYLSTNVAAIFPDGTEQVVVSTEPSFSLPDTFKFAQTVTAAYEMTILEGVKSDYNIALFTDKNELGSVEGDYIGFYYSINPNPSNNPVDYAWASIKVRIQKFINDAFDNLLERVQTNERYLYGRAVEDTTNTQTGINSAINVGNNSLNISNKSYIQLSENDSMAVNTDNNYLYFNNIAFEAASDGHLRLVIRERGTN